MRTARADDGPTISLSVFDRSDERNHPRSKSGAFHRRALEAEHPDIHACTSGPATSEELDRYLEHQSEHHGYDRRASPPVYVQTWAHTAADGQALQAQHSATRIRWHLVFSGF